MKYYPAYLDLRNRSCLVVGGGAVAERKTLSLLDAGAAVVVVSPTLTPRLQKLSDAGSLTHKTGKFDEKDLAGRVLAIAATDSPEVNRLIADACGRNGILVNVAVPPEAGSFIVPSVINRGDLLIAVSTSGASPALAKKIRRDLEKKYGEEYGLLLELLAEVRTRVMTSVADEKERKKIFQAIVDSDAVNLLREGRAREAASLISNITGQQHPA